MTYTQYTVAKELIWEGTALHSGHASKVTVAPAEAGFGIRFKRVDIEAGRWISADAKYVVSTLRSTNIGAGGQEIGTIEHLMAALAGVGIDNAEVLVDGPELPILDGSAAPFYDLISEHVAAIEVAATTDWSPRETIEYTHEETGASYLLIPSDTFACEALITYASDRIGDKYAAYQAGDDFATLSKARTFVFSKDLVGLAKQGLIKGGDLDNAMVIPSAGTGEVELREALTILDRKDIDNTVERVREGFSLHTPNELAQHKLVDLIGDLSLLGCKIKAKIIAKKPGHTSNIAFVNHLRPLYQKALKLNNKPHYDPDKEPLYDVEGVKRMLPHRYPFLMVDKILELSETHVVGIKNITFNEGLFQGHFPGNPVFPGVLQMEALAQTGGILALSQVEDPGNWDTYFLKMDSVKFKRMVKPGDTLLLKMELLSPIRRGIVHMKGTTYVGDNIASEGELTAQIVKRKAE